MRTLSLIFGWRLWGLTLVLALWPCCAARSEPPPAPALPGRQVFVLPYTPLGSNFSQVQIVSGTLNGSFKTSFLLDTGSNRAILAADTVAMLHLKTIPRLDSPQMIDGVPEIIAPSTVIFDGFGFDLQPDVLNRSHFNDLGVKADGIIGTDNLRTLALLFDFRRHTITLISGGNLSSFELRTLGVGGVNSMPVTELNGLYMVNARLGTGFRQRAEALVIDTGSDTTVISRSSAQALSLETVGPDTGNRGFFQANTMVRHSHTELDIGNVVFSDQMVTFPASEKSGLFPRLGLDVLSHYRVLLDFPAGKMYLAPPSLSVPVKPSAPDAPAAPAPAVSAPADGPGGK